MPDKTTAFVLLSGSVFAAQNLSDAHRDETSQWRNKNVRGAVQPLFLAQKGMEHIMSTELLSTPQSSHDSRPQIHSTVGPSHGAAPSPLCCAPADGSIGSRFAATAASILGQACHNSVSPVTPVANVAPMSTPARGQTNRPRRATSRSGNVAPSVPQPRNSSTFHHFPASDPSDSAYSEWLVKHALHSSSYLDRRCAATFTIDNRDIIFTGNFVNPATSSAWAEARKATLSALFCVTFNDDESLRYKAVKLSHKIELIADITANDSIHDMLGLDSLTPLPRLKVAFNKTLRIVNPNEDRDPGVESGELRDLC